MQLADSHIHVFKPTFAEATGSGQVLKSELTTYEYFRKVHDIGPALVVGYEGMPAYKNNNADIAALAKKRPWMKTLAYHPCNGMSAAWVGERFDEGHVGISIYCETESDARAMERWASKTRVALNARQAFVSINAKPEAMPVLSGVLQELEECRILMSHLGIPGPQDQTPSSTEARRITAPMRRLARLENVGVKVSGLYQVSVPGSAYPHDSAVPLVRQIAEDFGTERLYWGSDFAPSLSCVSFAQTIEAVERIGWDDDELAAIMGGNLIRLLAVSD